MPESLRLSFRDADFTSRFEAFVHQTRAPENDVAARVSTIIKDVRTKGDAAVLALTKQYDRQDLTPATMRVPQSEIEKATATLDKPVQAALTLAAQRIRAFHEQQKPQDLRYQDEAGVILGAQWTPIEAAGLYVPGGAATYPSSVLMNAIPAQVAGVERLVMVVPTPDGILNPTVLAAAHLAGVHEIYRIGGAQAIAALAYGTKTIAPVDMISGPGNAYVAEAKRQIFGDVGIDMIAGPSEILVVAAASANPTWIAYDLLSQAEHDEVAQAILICDDVAFADAVSAAIETCLATLPRANIARHSWQTYGAIFIVEDITKDAAPLVNRLAPEHLELAVPDPDSYLPSIRHAGAIFLGQHTPEAVGDYIGGPNHILPTNRAARYASGLSVLDFMKRSTLIGCDADALAAIGGAACTLAEAEGLDAHARSIAVRLNKKS